MKTVFLIVFLFAFLVGFGQTKTLLREFEGFYQIGWEQSSFFEKRGNNVYRPFWFEFDESLKLPDSIKILLKSKKLYDGVFMKIKGVKDSVGAFGHLGFYESQITAKQIISIDTTVTFENYIFNQTEKNEKVDLSKCSFTFDTLTNRNVYYFVDSMPVFPNGSAAMLRFISENIRYPRGRDDCTTGMVVVSFIVEASGQLTNKKIVKGIFDSVDSEALAVIDKMPYWVPGTCNGVKLPVKIIVPIKIAIK